MWRKPINADTDSCARSIKAGYYKTGPANFIRYMGGVRIDGFSATGVMEEYEEDDTDKHDL